VNPLRVKWGSGLAVVRGGARIRRAPPGGYIEDPMGLLRSPARGKPAHYRKPAHMRLGSHWIR